MRALSSFVQSGRIPHAIMFNGQQGCGKFTLAVIFAKNVLSHGLEPAAADRICHLIDEGIHPDVCVTAPNERGLITVDAIRAIGEQLYKTPNEGSKRIVIIKDCEQMNEQAQNALLKMLEEPPSHVLFLLACNQSGKLLPTIISRVLSFDIVPPAREEAANYVKNLGFDAQVIEKAALLFDGNIEKMIEYAKGDNTESFACACQVLQALCAKKPADLAECLQGVKTRQQLAEICSQIKMAIGIAGEHSDALDGVSLSRLKVAKILKVLDRAEQTLALNGNLNLTLTWFASALFAAQNNK